MKGIGYVILIIFIVAFVGFVDLNLKNSLHLLDSIPPLRGYEEECECIKQETIFHVQFMRDYCKEHSHDYFDDHSIFNESIIEKKLCPNGLYAIKERGGFYSENEKTEYVVVCNESLEGFDFNVIYSGKWTEPYDWRIDRYISIEFSNVPMAVFKNIYSYDILCNYHPIDAIRVWNETKCMKEKCYLIKYVITEEKEEEEIENNTIDVRDLNWNGT